MRKGYRLYENEGLNYVSQLGVVDNGDLTQRDNDSIQKYIDDNVDPKLNRDPDIIKHINEFSFDELSNYIYDQRLLDQKRNPTTDRIVNNGRPFLIKAWVNKEGNDEYGYYYEGYIQLRDMRTGCVWSFVDRDVMPGYFELWDDHSYDSIVEEEESRLTKEDYYVNRKDFEE